MNTVIESGHYSQMNIIYMYLVITFLMDCFLFNYLSSFTSFSLNLVDKKGFDGKMLGKLINLRLSSFCDKGS